MREVFRSLSIAAGALSLVMLIKQGVDFGLIAPFSTVLEFYDGIVNVVGEWLHPAVAAIADALSSLLRARIEFSPLWKHIVTVNVVLMTSLARGTVEVMRGRWGEDIEWWLPSAMASSAVVLGAMLGLFSSLFDAGDGGIMALGVTYYLMLGFLLWRRVPDNRVRALFLSGYTAVPLAAALFVLTNAGLKLAGVG